MPDRPWRECWYAGCTTLTRSGECDAHPKPAARTYQRDPAVQKLYDRKWRKRRAAHLAENPWCVECMKSGQYVPATDVHHVTPHRGDVTIFITSPLESDCHSHHSVHTGREKRERKSKGTP